MYFAGSQADKCRNGSPQIEEGVHLDGGFGFAVMRPREKGKAQIDSSGIESIKRKIQIYRQFLVLIKPSCDGDKMICNVLINKVISLLVGIGQGGSRYLSAESDVIKLLVVRVQACLNISQAFTVRNLGKGKAEELIITGKFPDPVIALVFFDALVKLITWQMLQYLCKNGFPGIHRQPSPRLLKGRYILGKTM